MALSNAERQRRWRQRQRETNHKEYLKKERKRKRDSYVPTNQLSEEKKEERCQKCRKDFHKHYKRKKELIQAAKEQVTEAHAESNQSKKNDSPLKVKFAFSKMKKARKRHPRALRKANRDMADLKKECEELSKAKRTLQRKIQRWRRVSPEIPSNGQDYKTPDKEKEAFSTDHEDTPRSRSKFLLRKAGINLKRNSHAYKRLVLGNAIIDSMKRNKGKKTKQSNKNYIGAMIIKKYRCMAQVSKELGLSRKKVSRLVIPRASKSIRQKYGEQVKAFLEREDNSTFLPGKRDAILKGKQATQKRVLNDYLHNLHQKFLLEHPEIKLSRSSFSKPRPNNIILTSFSSRKTCLCTYHQNFALKVKSMQREGLKCSSNPDVFIKEFDSGESLHTKLSEVCENDRITFRMWKKVPDGEKIRWKEIEETVSKDEFIETVVREHEKFSAHVKRVQNQYMQMCNLRENLPSNDVLIWMDFAENFSCSSVEEVQSAYWNCQMVSLHTMVVYFPNNRNKSVQSYVAISSSLSHNAAAVYAILKKLVPMVKKEFPQLQQIHYLTDSPSSQYRNKSNFQVVCEHEEEFGVRARWNYLETGHGKGPCDGLGASAKKSADMAVKQEKCLIHDADDFHEWAKSAETESKVRFLKYSEEEIEKATAELKGKDPVSTISGTMKVHAIAPVSKNTIAVRELSCYCHDCISSGPQSKCGWDFKLFVKAAEKTKKPKPLLRQKNTKETPLMLDQMATVPEEITEQNPDNIALGEWVVTVYEGMWYIGQVTEIKTESDEFQINFLEKSGKYDKSYKFPLVRDEIMIPRSDILMQLKEFKAVGKTKRSYKLLDKEELCITQKYIDWLNKNN